MMSNTEDECLKRKSRPNKLFKDFHTKKRVYSPVAESPGASSSDDELPTFSPRIGRNNARKNVIESESSESEGEISQISKVSEVVVQSSCDNCQNSEAKLDSLIRKVDMLSHSLISKVDMLSHDVTFLLHIVQRNAISQEAVTPDDLDLPITKGDHLKDFEEKLADAKFFDNMVASLMSVGGKDVADNTRRILSKLISHELSLQYNWTGRGKKEFMTLKNILKLILVCLRRNLLTRNATDAEIGSVVKIWLKTAADRQGGRSRRRTKTLEEGCSDK